MSETHKIILTILMSMENGGTAKQVYLKMEPSEQGLFAGGAAGVAKIIDTLQRYKTPKIARLGVTGEGNRPEILWAITEHGKDSLNGKAVEAVEVIKEQQQVEGTTEQQQSPTIVEMLDMFERTASDLTHGFGHITQAFKLTLQELDEVKAELGAQSSPSDLFSIGDTVSKVGGDYSFDGKVVAVFEKLGGAVRLVVEDERGILHIYNEKNLEKR